ncbi:hypothetical protein [Hyphomicrobium sp.]|uniref:hypothetical protein n=1 Tax=Hyphomicrobium sp. TaxID=82 RepID=UPI0025C0DEBF|nr:hypothetical protein [Hyphomicrobium sp.]
MPSGEGIGQQGVRQIEQRVQDRKREKHLGGDAVEPHRAVDADAARDGLEAPRAQKLQVQQRLTIRG